MLGLLVALLLIAACAMRPERLPPVQRSYYRLIETQKERAVFLELDAAGRQAYVERRGFAQAWTALDPRQQASILEGKIELGFSRFAVHMAWGLPADEKQVLARGRRLWLETYIQCTSGPRVERFVFDHLECDGTSTESQVIFEKGKLIELRALD